MFCTGGIRCEKASNFLLNTGLKKVYQLEGGIINYLSKTKNQSKIWLGECFVFDERVSLNEKLDKGVYLQCFACRTPITKEDLQSKFYRKGISCPHCFNKTTKNQKKNFKEREKQINLAKIRGVKHLGSQSLPIFGMENFFIFSISVVLLIFKLAEAFVTDPPFFFKAPSIKTYSTSLKCLLISILSKKSNHFL